MRKSTCLGWMLMLSLSVVPAAAEEGMWTFDNPPSAALQRDHDFSPAQAWLDEVRLASVRFMDGGSGSFVSPFGLVVTNHHVAVNQLQKMSSREKNYVRDGFYAARPAEEIKCPDLEVNVLVSMENVTDRVMGTVKDDMSPEQALQARKAERARIEKESMEKTGLRSDVVSLYHGGAYWLYRYRRYTDVRLVFAPERQAAFYGGDFDNFTYPRYDLDVAFLRVYQDGKPLSTEHHFRWSTKGASPGELVFITGHPGSTRRLDTMAQLDLLRDTTYGLKLTMIDRFLEALKAHAAKGAEQARRAQFWRFALGNAKKALGGELRALEDPELMAMKARAEQELRKRVQANPEWKQAYGGAWKRIEQAVARHGEEASRRVHHSFFLSRLASMAVTIVKYVQEVQKPDAERLDGFHDSEIEKLEFKLFSPAPIHRDIETVMLATSFRLSLDKLAPDDPFARILAGLGDPAAAAARLAGETRLVDPAYRKELVEGGAGAVEASDDPLIALARKVVPILVEDEKWKKKHIESVTTPAREQIARARFAVYGKDIYPDATFSLRMTYGTVRGYPMNGTRAPAVTTLYGLFDRALGFENKGPWRLPNRFWDRRAKLDLATPVNFVSDCDIIGGNSGSPVINRKAELVGVVFDGNIESLSNRFLFDAEHSRAVAVHSAYVLEALCTLYDARDLADEIAMR